MRKLSLIVIILLFGLGLFAPGQASVVSDRECARRCRHHFNEVRERCNNLHGEARLRCLREARERFEACVRNCRD